MRDKAKESKIMDFCESLQESTTLINDYARHEDRERHMQTELNLIRDYVEQIEFLLYDK